MRCTAPRGSQELIARYYDEKVLEALAVEARKGRVLNIGTTNLDVERPVIWRISAIATSDHPDRLELIRKIILASASIPAAFPPVTIEVEANGQFYDELHVDGGTSSQVFLYPAAIDLARVLKKVESPAAPRSLRHSQLPTRPERRYCQPQAAAHRQPFDLSFDPLAGCR